MSIDRRITNGLAWAGVLLVVGIPAADFVSAQFAGTPNAATVAPAQVAVVERVAPIPAPLSQRPASPVAQPATQVAVAAPAVVATPAKPVVVAPVQPAQQVAAVAPTKPAAVTTAPRPAAETADVVDAWLNSGKALPSYITEAAGQPAQVAATPPARTPIVTTPAAIDPIQVAAIAPQKVAPVPMPLSMRPRPIAVALVPPTQAVVIPPGLSPAAPGGVTRPPANVTADDLQDWETGPLSEFLASRQAGNADVDPDYDADGFYLDQGPNRRPRVIPPQNSDEPFFLLFD